MIIIIGESIIGILGNGYIGLVNWIDWIKKKKISSVDYILSSLAISRVCLLCVMLVSSLTMLFNPDAYESDKPKIIDIFWIFTNYLSMWLASYLNVFYFLKITNFSHPLFLWLKWRIDRKFHWVLLGCLVISLLSSLMLTLIPNYCAEFLEIAKCKRNFTELFRVMNIQYFNLLSLFNVLAIVPLTVSLISFFLLIISLWRHIKQMKLNVTGCRDPSTQAHVGAMKTVSSFLCLLFVYYLASLLMTFSYRVKKSKLTVMFGEITAILYPSVHSFVLIVGNNKLRQASVRLLRCRETACVK